MKGASLAGNLDVFRETLAAGEEDAEELCHWLIKRFLRQGMRLVMTRERALYAGSVPGV